MEEYYIEKIDKIEQGLRALGLETCDECGEWKDYLKNVNVKIGDEIINKDICVNCENYKLKCDIV